MSAPNKTVEFYSKVKSTKVNWLWYPYIPYGKITIIQGDPGEGKTSLALYLISIISQGKAFPLSDTPVPQQNVIYQNKEDDTSDTVKPRLENYGANCEKIGFILEEEKDLSLMDERLETSIREVKEETGIDIEVDTNYRYTTSYSPMEGVMKEVVFFLGKVLGGELKPQEKEVSKVDFISFTEAENSLTHEDTKEILRQVLRDIKK